MPLQVEVSSMQDLTNLLLDKLHNTVAHALGIIILLAFVFLGNLIGGSWGITLIVISLIITLIVAIHWAVSNNRMANEYWNAVSLQDKKE